MEAENRLTTESTGNNTDFSMNFVPKMNYQELLAGYKNIIQNIYATKPYYKSIRQFLLNFKRFHTGRMKIRVSYLVALFKPIIIIGIINKGRREYWKLLIWTLFRRPGFIVDAMILIVYGYHFRNVYRLRS